MATFNYESIRGTAGRLIEQFGKPVTLRVPTDTVPVKPWRPVTTYADTVMQAVVTEFEAREIDGTKIQSGDRRYLGAAEGLAATPTTKDQLVDGSEILEIRSVNRLSPGGTKVIYKFHARPTGSGS